MQKSDLQQAVSGVCNKVPACLVGHDAKKDTKPMLAGVISTAKNVKNSDAGTAAVCWLCLLQHGMLP